MELNYIIYYVLALLTAVCASKWNNLNCPAPRSPDNGLSFIFRNGELVQFRCHPGYLMLGAPVAYCVNNEWTRAAPDCVPIRRRGHHSNRMRDQGNVTYSNRQSSRNADKTKTEKQRQLFNWGDQASTQNIYGDGPRRLPLINGIWPPQDHAERVLSLGPQSTLGPRTMVKEEVDIAELRNKQLEELKKQRYNQDGTMGNHQQVRRRNRKKNSITIDESIPRETIVSLGSTEDGEALSVAFVKPNEELGKSHHRHRYHHNRGGRRRKHNNNNKRRKFYAEHPGYSNFITSRKSRVDNSGVYPYHAVHQLNTPIKNDIAELRRRPVEQVQRHPNRADVGVLSKYDATCFEAMYKREVPKIAPEVPNAFVYRYQTKKNKGYPYNSYMEVKYRCLGGYVSANSINTLYCKDGSWIGETPQCVSGRKG